MMHRKLISFVILLLALNSNGLAFRTYSKEDVFWLREEVRDMFQHAYDGYLKYAGDYDELRPISCDGVDTWGSYSLTLIDALDTLAVMGNYTEFRRVVGILTKKTNFDADINVSVFETNIRIVGGLLGAHLLSSQAGLELEPGWPCNGPLLRLAEDVAKRLLPAFDTKTGMPFGTVNLRYGVPSGETTVTCTAGVGTFIVEFGALSRLTGDPIYEEVALNALYALWKHRSPIGLFGNHIDIQTGRWTAQDAGIGAGVDSYYEYLVKGALMLNRPELLEMFHIGRKAIDKYLKRDDWHVWVSMNKGQVTLPVFQSLEAYWPGVLSLIGDIAPAMKTLHNYHSVWKQYGFLPEFYNIPSAEAGANRENYPLRPELIESVMYLYRATSDPYLLEVGEDMLRSIQYSAKTTCGYATIKNVRDHRKEDRMESFFLAETTKYLYLLFDPENFIHNDGREGILHETPNGVCVIQAGGYIFNTEAHPIDPSALRCCHDTGDWFKDFSVEKFIGYELERKDDDKIGQACPEKDPTMNMENITIEIETVGDSEEERQQMVSEIMDILKRLESETSRALKKLNETEFDETPEVKRRTDEKSEKELFRESLISARALENLINMIRLQEMAAQNDRLTYVESKMTELLLRLEKFVLEYVQVLNTTVEEITSKTDKSMLVNLNITNRQQIISNYQNIAYYKFMLNIFEGLGTLQQRSNANGPENVPKLAANILHSLQSGVGEAFFHANHPDIMKIFRTAQEDYEKFLAKNNLTIEFYFYTYFIQKEKLLSKSKVPTDFAKLVVITNILNEKKQAYEKMDNMRPTLPIKPLNFQLFDRVFKILTKTIEFNASSPNLMQPIDESHAKPVNDDIIIVDTSTEQDPLELTSHDPKYESNLIDDQLDDEPTIGKGTIEEVSLDGEFDSLHSSHENQSSRTQRKSEEATDREDNYDEVPTSPALSRRPKINEAIDSGVTNNSLLTDFVQTILKSTMPKRSKFEPQLLLEKIRAEGNYNDQLQNFELLTCRAQPFLQRVSINGEFF